MMQGIAWSSPEVAPAVSQAAFARGLLAETCGAEDQVLKLLPPLTIGEAELEQGLRILEQAIATVVGPKQASA